MAKLKRDIRYLNKDFAEYRDALINYAKNYFPRTYSDFNESDPGMMFIEMAAYVGDVLSAYGDIQLQESLLSTVEEKINLYNISQAMGYKIKTYVPSSVELDVYQLIPSIGEGNDTRPDYTYALLIEPNMVVSADNEHYFRTVDPVDFRFSSSFDPTHISVHSVTDDGSIEYYLLRKTVKAISGQIFTAEYTFTDPKLHDKIVINDTDVSEVVDIYDSSGNKWHEVQFMAQDMIPIPIRNVPYTDPYLSNYRSSVPYLLTYQKVDRRYVTRLRRDDRIEIQFGSGIGGESDEEIIPNPMNIGIGMNYFERSTDVSVDPMNFLYTRTYGQVPYNTTLTVRYAKVNGMSDNVNSNTITTINSIDIVNPLEDTDASILNVIRSSIGVNNPYPAFGGMDRRPMDVVRHEAMAHFAAQNRAVTKEDYILRCFTMPPKFGGVAKAYVEQDTQVSPWNAERQLNPHGINLYILTYDNNGRFVHANPAIKENLRQYLRQYRLMTDAINIIDPFIINIGIEFDIITRPEENSGEVLLRCINRMKELTHNDKMEINGPIILSKLYTELDKLDGVQTVQKIKFVNLFDVNRGYSGNVYNIDTATRNGILYPSVDPCIFEVRFPNRDIVGRVNDI